MRITYRTLAQLIERMSDEQKNCDVTFEDIYDNECFGVCLAICGENHDSLDDGHPVLIGYSTEASFMSDVDQICKKIGLV